MTAFAAVWARSRLWTRHQQRETTPPWADQVGPIIPSTVCTSQGRWASYIQHLSALETPGCGAVIAVICLIQKGQALIVSRKIRMKLSFDCSYKREYIPYVIVFILFLFGTPPNIFLFLPPLAAVFFIVNPHVNYIFSSNNGLNLVWWPATSILLIPLRGTILTSDPSRIPIDLEKNSMQGMKQGKNCQRK